MHDRILAPGEAVGVDEAVAHHLVAGATRAVLAAQGVDAGYQLDVGPGEGGGETSAHGAAVHLGGHGHRHHAVRVRHAQAEVVHHVVRVVVVELRLQLVEYAAEAGLLEAQAQALALELGAVHAAPGIAGLAVAASGGQLDQGVGIGRPADGQVAVPLLPARGHGVAVAILVVVRPCLVAHEAQVALLAADGTVQHLVQAAVGTAQQAGVQAAAEFAEAFRLAFEQHRAGRGTGAPEHGLRALDHGQPVEGLRCDVGAGRVHPVGAGAEHQAAVGAQVDARAEHAAQHRVAVAAAAADGGKAGDGLEVVGGIAGRHRLAGVTRVGDHRQRRTLLHGGDHGGRQLGVSGVLGQRRSGHGQGQCG